jgi:hypothetical protein
VGEGEGCSVQYEELQGQGHFFRPFPQLLKVLAEYIRMAEGAPAEFR